MASTDFPGFIEHPIDAEEHWINERVELTFNSINSIRHSFIHASISALINWPHWETVPRSFGEAKGEKNYFYTLNQSHDTNVELKREDLFYMLVNEIPFHSFAENKQQFIDIFRSFQSWDPKLYPLTNSSWYDQPLNLQAKLLAVISWISKEDASLAVEALVRDWTNMPHGVTKHLALLQVSSVSQLCWQHLGQDRFHSLFETLESFEAHNKAQKKLSVLARLKLCDLIDALQPISQRINTLVEENYLLNFRHRKESIELSATDCDEFKAVVNNSLVHTSNWYDYLGHDLWQKSPFSNELPRELLTYVLLAPLIEMVNGNITDNSINVLSGFSDNKNTFRTALIFLESDFFDAFIQYIITEISQQQDQRNAIDVLERIIVLKAEIHQDDLNDSMDFL